MRVSFSLNPHQHFLLVFDNGYDRYEEVLHCALDFLILRMRCWACFHMSEYLCLFFGENYSVLSPIFQSSLELFFHNIFYESFSYLVLPFFRYVSISAYNLSHSKVAFLFSWWFLLLCKAFGFDELPFVYFCFFCSCLRRQVKKTIAKSYVHEHTGYVIF